MHYLISLLVFLSIAPLYAEDKPVRVAMLNADFSRDGPGILIRDLRDNDPSILPTLRAIIMLQPDIVLLTDVDQDDQTWAANLIAQKLNMGYFFVGPHNRGVQSGYDLNKDGRFDENDTIGFGEFRGQHSMVIFSKTPIIKHATFSQVKWADVNGAIQPAGHFSELEWQEQLLSGSGFWDIEIKGIRFVASYATTPAFDGEEDRNGLRNMAEIKWLGQYLTGAAHLDDTGASSQIDQPFVAFGTFNLDPQEGDGHREVMAQLLSNPRIKDYGPEGTLGLATADWRDKGYGALRADYILPSCELKHLDGGMIPIENNPHFLIWLDLMPTPNCN